MQTLYDNQAGYENIELLEDSALYELSVDKLHNLYLEDIHIANWGRKFAERECIKSEKLFISRQFKTSLERYQAMREDNPLRQIQDSGKLIITPHIAWAPKETRERLLDGVYENIKKIL